MKDLALKSVITGKDGFYYREEHEWRGMNPDSPTCKLLAARLAQADEMAKKIASGKADDGLSAVLSASIDGVASADITVTGLSYGEVNAFQKQWQAWGNEIVASGGRHAANADEKRGWHKRENRVAKHLG
jgi:DNA recombination-dependent growth factor C